MQRTLFASAAVLLAAIPGTAIAADDPASASGGFGPAGTLADERKGHTATLLPGGRVLVVGGRHQAMSTVATAGIWDPTMSAEQAAVHQLVPEPRRACRAGSAASALAGDAAPTNVAFTSFRDGDAEVYAVAPDGSGLTDLSSSPRPDGRG